MFNVLSLPLFLSFSALKKNWQFLYKDVGALTFLMLKRRIYGLYSQQVMSTYSIWYGLRSAA